MARCVIAIETSSRRGSVAVAEDGARVRQIELSADRRHTSQLLPAIRTLCGQMGWGVGEITAVYFSRGPGSFTGLRVAATLARMLHWSLGCEVVAVPSLEVIALNATSCEDRPARIAVVLDAKRGQVFGALFEQGGGGRLRTVDQAALRDPAEWFAAIERPFCVMGDGVAVQRQTCAASGARVLDESRWMPTAANVAAIGDRMLDDGMVCRSEEIVPVYIRRPEAEEVYEKNRADARRRRGE